jgi:phospholipid transport system transporter-binding protein
MLTINTDSERHQLLLSGRMLYENATESIRAGEHALCAISGDITLDFSQLERLDTAGVAVLLAWLRGCKQRNQKMVLTGLPQQATSLIVCCGLSTLLLLESEGASL